MAIFIKSIWFSGPLGVFFSAVEPLPHHSPPPPFPHAIADFCTFLPSEIAGLCPWSLKRRRAAQKKLSDQVGIGLIEIQGKAAALLQHLQSVQAILQKGRPESPRSGPVHNVGSAFCSENCSSHQGALQISCQPVCRSSYLVISHKAWLHCLSFLCISSVGVFRSWKWSRMQHYRWMHPPPSLLSDTQLLCGGEETKIQQRLRKWSRLIPFLCVIL